MHDTGMMTHAGMGYLACRHWGMQEVREGPHPLLRSGITWLYILHSRQESFREGGGEGWLDGGA